MQDVLREKIGLGSAMTREQLDYLSRLNSIASINRHAQNQQQQKLMRIHRQLPRGRPHPLHGENERQHAQDKDADEEERIGEGERCGLPDEFAVEHAVGSCSWKPVGSEERSDFALGHDVTGVEL